MSDRDSNALAASAERIYQQLREGIDDDQFEVPDGVHGILKLLAGNQDDKSSSEAARHDATVDDDSESPAITIGRFRLTTCLGQGGYGVVYLARDTLLNRTVAVKLPKPHVLLTSQLRARFLREARAASAMHHPHIAQVYDASEAEAACFIASEYCDGGSLDEWLREQERPLDPTTIAQLMMPISDAVHHAHLAGILHRDLKPGNILLKSEVGYQANPIPYVAKVADFGLAKLESPDEETTISGAILGSIRYMSPEQATGNNREIDGRSDVYSLGVIIYQLLTGKPPFTGESQLQLLRDVVDKTPTSVRTINPSIPRDLAAICMKCLEKKPSRRYLTAADLRDDLRRFLAGRPTVARPIGPFEAAGRWSLEYPAKAALIGVIFASVLAGITGLVIHSRIIGSSLTESQQLAHDLQQRERELRTKNYASDTAFSFGKWRGQRPKQASALLAGQRHRPSADSYLGIESHLLDQLVHPPTRVLYQSDYPVHGRLLPDGDTYAFVEGTHEVHFIDLNSGQRMKSLASPFVALRELSASADGRFLAVSSESPRNSEANARPPSRVGAFDLTKGGFRELGHHGSTVESLVFAPQGYELVSASRYENLLRRDVTATAAPSSVPNLSRNEAVRYSPDGKLLAYTSHRKSRDRHFLQLENLETGTSVTRPLRRKDEYVCFSHDGAWLVVSNLYDVEIYDTNELHVVETLANVNVRTAAIAFTPDDQFLAIATRDGAIRFWEQQQNAKQNRTANREYRRRFVPIGCTNHHADRIRSLSFDDQQRMITAGDDGSIRICELASFLKPRSIGPDTGSARSLAQAPDGTLALALSDGRHWVKRPNRDPIVAKLNRYSNAARHIALSNDAKWMAYSVRNRFDVLSIDEMQTLSWTSDQVATAVTGLSFVPKRDQLITTHQHDSHLYVWDVAEQSLVDKIAFARAITAPRFTSDGKTLIVCEVDSKDTQMFVCDGKTFKQDRRVPLEAPAFSTCFDANNSTLAVGHVDGRISLWNTREWDETHWLVEHDPVYINALAFSPDGRTLASGSDDGSIRLWHVETGVELGNLARSPDIKVRGLAFPHQGQSLIVAHVTGGPPLVEYHGRTEPMNTDRADLGYRPDSSKDTH